MKKLLFLLIATTLLIGFSGVSAFAKDPASPEVDRHAVWTHATSSGKWSQGPMISKDRKSNPFDFIRETKSYEYNKGSKQS